MYELLTYTEIAEHLLVGLGTLFIGIAAIWALFKGFSKYERALLSVETKKIELHEDEDRRSLRFKLASEAIDLFHRAKTDIQIVRSAFVREGEIQELEALEETNDLIKSAKKSSRGGITLLRVDARGETFAALARLQPKFQLVFETKEPFERIFTIWNRIKNAAESLIIGNRNGDLEKIVWEEADADNEIANEVDQIIEQIDRLCKSDLKI